MSRTLLVTNDFPPTLGGIQSYLRDFVGTLDPAEIIVLASTQDAEAARQHDAQLPYRVIRWPRRVMLPTPATAREMARLIGEHDIDTVWFGAAAPLALMAAAARRAGARRIIATTHGHEVGWSMLPGARQVLRRIGDTVDTVTYISDYTLARFRRVIGTHPEFVHLPSGVDTGVFTPADDRRRAATRERFGLGEGPVIICVSRLVPRKGQDQLIRVLPHLRATHPDLNLVLVGGGGHEKQLRALAGEDRGVIFAGRLPFRDMVDLLAASDIFAMPVRTRGKGLDVEGLGIVYLEAQSCALPVLAGDSGGAPETVTAQTGTVVDGRDLGGIAAAMDRLLADPDLRARMGRAGRAHVEKHWTWDIMGSRLRELLAAR